MAGGALDAAVGLFERRFVTNALLPVLLLAPAVAAPVLLQDGRLDDVAVAWDAQSSTLKLLEIAGYLALVWFLAAVLASQWRNVTRLFEGYPLGRLGPVRRAAVEWHRARRSALASDPIRRHLYYARDDRVMPTALGNILRAAEDYPNDRYDASFLTLWSRLYFVLPTEVQENIEWARARMEFLLVVSAWGAAFAWLTLALNYALESAGTVLVGCFFGGMALAALAYQSALFAAVEYGNRMRATFELHRLQLLQRLGFASPETLEEERELWQFVNTFVVKGLGEGQQLPVAWERKWMYQAPPTPELVVRFAVDPESPS